MRPFDFLQVPDEIKLMIVLNLPVWDLIRCQQVCKQWNVMIKTSTVAQFTIELARYGLVPCSSKNWTAAAALRRLREQQEGWRQCKWKTKKFIDLQGNCKTYELRNSVWAFGHCEDNPANSDLGSIPPDYTTTITCFELPSGSPTDFEGDIKQWSLHDLGMSIRDFTMDPLVNLIVLVEQVTEPRENVAQHPFRLHLRRLSDGEPHPMATQPIIPIKMTTSDPSECVFDVQLQETSVGVLIRQQADILDDYDHLAVWNWQTGDLEFVKCSNVTPYDDFTFIDSCSIILASMENPATLHVYRFENSKVYFTGAFELPPTRAEFTYLELHFDGGPSASIAGPGSVDGTPYSLMPHPEILSVTFGVVEARADLGESEVSGFTMIACPKLMLGKLKSKTADIPKDQMRDELRVLRWKDWGPDCTRWLPQQLDYLSWQPCMQGGRLALVTPASEIEDIQNNTNAPFLSHRKQVIRIYDFREDVILRNLEKGLKDGLQLLPIVIPKRSMFEEDVTSCLPYHLVESELLPIPVSGVMIDEGRMVCTRAEDNDDWRQLLVLTF